MYELRGVGSTKKSDRLPGARVLLRLPTGMVQIVMMASLSFFLRRLCASTMLARSMLATESAWMRMKSERTICCCRAHASHLQAIAHQGGDDGDLGQRVSCGRRCEMLLDLIRVPACEDEDLFDFGEGEVLERPVEQRYVA